MVELLYKQESYIIQGGAFEIYKQFWYYLKATDYRLGYLINFGNLRGVQIIRKIYDTARQKV